MNKLPLILLALSCALIFTAGAQDTNVLKTEIGVFEARTGSIIIKGFEPVGTVVAGSVVISVADKESIDVGTGRKVYGIVVALGTTPTDRDRTFVDYDELDSLLNSIDYFIKIDYDITTLPSFEATYSTKSSLRLIAHSIRREGTVQCFIQYDDNQRIPLSSVQLKQLYELIEKAKKNLDALRDAK